MISSDCIFCQLTSDEILVPEQRLREESDYYLILSLHPQTKGHTLLIPKKHFSSLTEIPKELQAILFQEAIKEAEYIQNSLGAKAYILRVNNMLYKLESRDKGHVGHIHIHIIPRYKSGEKLLEKNEPASKESLMEIRRKLVRGVQSNDDKQKKVN